MSELQFRPRTSRDTHLRVGPHPVTPLGSSSEEQEETSEIEDEQLLDVGLSAEEVKNSSTAVTFLVIVAIIVIVLAVAVVGYLLYKDKIIFAPATPTTTIVAELGQSCTTLPCASPLICQGGVCVGQLHGPCSSNATCVTGNTCFENQCLGGPNQRCDTNSDCEPGLVCSTNTCVAAS
jgi:nitrate reductase NapE component